MIQPDRSDPMKVRRFLALTISVYAFLILPHLLLFYHMIGDADVSLLKAILTYVGILASGPIGAYLYAAHKFQNHGDR